MPVSGKVLVVEDMDAVRDTICRALVLSGYQAIPAVDLASARKLLTSETFDAILLDATLPDGDAEDLFSDGDIGAPTAIITGTCDGDRWLSLSRCADIMVPKPISLKGISKLVARLMDKLETPIDSFSERYHLSPRERLVLELAAQGRRDQEIADDISVAPGTLSTYWQRIFQKTGDRSQRDVLASLVRHLAEA